MKTRDNLDNDYVIVSPDEDIVNLDKDLTQALGNLTSNGTPGELKEFLDTLSTGINITAQGDKKGRTAFHRATQSLQNHISQESSTPDDKINALAKLILLKFHHLNCSVVDNRNKKPIDLIQPKAKQHSLMHIYKYIIAIRTNSTFKFKIKEVHKLLGISEEDISNEALLERLYLDGTDYTPTQTDSIASQLTTFSSVLSSPRQNSLTPETEDMSELSDDENEEQKESQSAETPTVEPGAQCIIS